MADHKIVGHFQIDRENFLGKGNIAQGVFKGINLATKQHVAAKQVYVDDEDEDDVRAVKMEVDALKDTPEHENIIKFLASIRDKQFLWIFTEFCELGDLNRYCKTNTVHFPLKVDIITQTAKAIGHLHHNNPPIIHRDIKPGNLILTQKNGKIVPKLCDFGLARPLQRRDGVTVTSLTVSARGTPLYMSPELFQHEDMEHFRFDRTNDIFSFGLMCAAFLEAIERQELDSIAPRSN